MLCSLSFWTKNLKSAHSFTISCLTSVNEIPAVIFLGHALYIQQQKHTVKMKWLNVNVSWATHIYIPQYLFCISFCYFMDDHIKIEYIFDLISGDSLIKIPRFFVSCEKELSIHLLIYIYEEIYENQSSLNVMSFHGRSHEIAKSVTSSVRHYCMCW